MLLGGGYVDRQRSRPTQLPSELAWSASIWDNIETLPSDLCSDEPPLETDVHLRQIILLIQSLESLWRDRQDFDAIAQVPEEIAIQEQQRADRLVEKLRELGVDPNELA